MIPIFNRQRRRSDDEQEVLSKKAAFQHKQQDKFRQLQSDPSVLLKWSWEDCHEMVYWMCSGQSAEENEKPGEVNLLVLHCLFSTGRISVNDPLRNPTGPGFETALSLSIANISETFDNLRLIEYLLKMGASPDIAVGGTRPNTNGTRPNIFPFDRLRDVRDPEPYYRCLLKYVPKPIRFSPDEVMLRKDMSESDFHNSVQVHHMAANFTPGIEYDVAQARADPDIVEEWSRLHAAFVFSQLIARRHRGPIPEDYFLFDLLLASRKVSVNDYILLDSFERKTALHQAVMSLNIDFVRFLLTKHHADPNRRSYVDGMPWQDVTHILYPICVALRAFLLQDDGEQEICNQIVTLLLEAGTRQDVLIESITALLHPDNLRIMSILEAMHFVQTARRLFERDPKMLNRFPIPVLDSITQLLSFCEQKWMKTNLHDSFWRPALCTSLMKEGSQLVVWIINSSGLPPPKPEIILDLINTRCHYTLGSLVYALGESLPMERLNYDGVRFSNPFTQLHADENLSPHDIYRRDAVRIDALITAILRSTSAAPRWMPLLQCLQRFLLLPGPKFPVDYLSLKNLCLGAVNDMIRNGRVISRDTLPNTFWNDLRLEKEFYTLCNTVF